MSDVYNYQPVVEALESFREEMIGYYNCLLLACASAELGGKTIDTIADGVVVTAAVNVGVEIEPIPIKDLRIYRSVYPHFITEVFHGKMIHNWQTLLNEIFAHYLLLHREKKRTFVELNKVDVKLSFSEADSLSLEDQTYEKIKGGFDFNDYPSRIKLINKLRNPSGKEVESLETINTHVHIRNAFQHQHGVLSDYAMAKLGKSVIRLLDDKGAEKHYQAGDKVVIWPAELNKLKRALLKVTHAWKT